MRAVFQTTTGLVSRVPGHVSTKVHAGWSHKTRQHSCSLKGRSGFRNKRTLPVLLSSARADEPSLVRQTRPSWNYKLGAVYQHLLPGPLLFLPSLLQPVSTIISLEGALHGHEWVHWLISLLPVPQVHAQAAYVSGLLTFTTTNIHDWCLQVVMQFPVVGLVDVLYQQHLDLANGVLDAAISLVGIYFSFALMPAMDAVLGTDLHPKSPVCKLAS